MFEVKKLSLTDKKAITDLFAGVFTREPWNDDWSDTAQLDRYIMDLIGQDHSLAFGLYDGDSLIGIALGYVSHWYTGTEYIINELCIQTERQGAGAGTFFLAEIEKALQQLGIKQIFLLTDPKLPAFSFYTKNGFIAEKSRVTLVKKLGD